MDVSRPKTPLVFRTRKILSSSDSEFSTPSTGGTSQDSGYESKATTPAKSPLQKKLCDFSALVLNGNSPDQLDWHNHPGDGELEFAETLDKTGIEIKAKHKKSYSLPQLHGYRCRPSLPSAFFTPSTPNKSSRRGSESEASLSATTNAPLRQPDRFVHLRSLHAHSTSVSDKFRLTRLPSNLTAREKLLRHSRASEDVFVPPHPRFNPVPTGADARQEAQEAAGVPPQMRATTTLGSVDFDADPELSLNQPVLRNGSMWSLGTMAPLIGAIDNGRGSLIQSGTNAQYFTSSFIQESEITDDEKQHSGRLAAALNIDLASRVFPLPGVLTSRAEKQMQNTKKTKWDGAVWKKEGHRPDPPKEKQDSRPLTILAAPDLRDDFYCSILAYCPTCNTVAVGLGDALYRWSEGTGARLLNGSSTTSTWLTALAFSSTQGGKSILAFGRSNNMLGLLSMYESGVSRMLIQEAAPISCLSWRPTYTMRPSKSPRSPGRMVKTEDLLVGDDTGNVMYYVVEWPDTWEAERDNWRGEMTLVSRISVHYQQICGLAWAFDGRSFATGGNDNFCSFFKVDNVLPKSYQTRVADPVKSTFDHKDHGQRLLGSAGSQLKAVLPGGSQIRERVTSQSYVRRVGPGQVTWQWEHGAAVKAIAFCPWQESLVATGGGSNDKCIHFFHTTSGAALATIFVSAQVTSLVWGTTRREIAATFGYTQPGQSIRIAVYSWPECKQVAAIPFEAECRVLYSISCSKGPHYKAKNDLPNDKKAAPEGRTLREGCIAVASSDESVKFFKLWPCDKKRVTGGVGMLGGSDILEDMEGIQKEGDIIR